MSGDELQRVRMPRESNEASQEPSTPPRRRFQKSTLTMAATIVGPLLIGGLVGEYFHTDQAYRSAVWRYRAESDKAGKDGVDALIERLNKALEEANSAKSSGNAQAKQILESGDIEAERVRNQQRMDSAKVEVINQQTAKWISEGNHVFYGEMIAALAKRRASIKSQTLGVGLTYTDPVKGFTGIRIFPVPHQFTNAEMRSICGFVCFQTDETLGTCRDEWAESHEYEGPRLTQETSSVWNLTLSSKEKTALQIYRQSLLNLESGVLLEVFDLERVKLDSQSDIQRLRWVDRELARLRIGLQNIRFHLASILEIEFLTSPGQRSATGASYLAADLVSAVLKDATGLTDEEKIRSWVNRVVPARVERIDQELREERWLASTWNRQASRNLLGQLWFWTRGGEIHPSALFTAPPADLAPPASFGARKRLAVGWAVPGWLLVIPFGLAVGGLYSLYVWKPRFAIALGVAVSLYLAFSIQEALRTNLSMADLSAAITKAIISSPDAYPFGQQASEIRNDLVSMANRERAELVGRATVVADTLPRMAFRMGYAQQNRGNCKGAGEMDTAQDYALQRTWVLEHLYLGPDGENTAEVLPFLDALSEAGEIWEKSNKGMFRIEVPDPLNERTKGSRRLVSGTTK